MARIMSIDFGRKRCGLAVTDSLKISVHPLETVETSKLDDFLDEYIRGNDIEEIVFGDPSLLRPGSSDLSADVHRKGNRLVRKYPDIRISFHDESYTSRDAAQKLVEVGVKKSKRQEKGMLDKMSAVLILQDYLGHI